MTSNKKFLQQLKRPDSFQIKALSYFTWVEKHKLKAAGFIAAAAVVCAGYFAWNYVSALRADQRRQKLAAVDFQFNEESEAAAKLQQDIHPKVAEIDQKLDPAEAQDDKKDALKIKLSPEERTKLEAEKKTFEAQIEALKPKHEASREKYLAYYLGHKTSNEGWRAALQVATIDMGHQQYSQAAELLKEMLPLAKGSYFYDMQVRAIYIGLLEELGKFEEGLSEAEQLVKTADEGMMPRALLIKGRLLLLSEKKTEAREIFHKLINEHNTSFEAGKAKAYNLL